MKDRPVIPETAGGRSDLQRTPRIPGGNQVGREGGDVPRFAGAELRRGLWLDQVVDPGAAAADLRFGGREQFQDRKSTRLNSSHLVISYAVFCLKKKTKTHTDI